MKTKILTALLTITLLATTANASTVDLPNKSNESVKKQCQYIVYGNGVNNTFTGFYMTGIVIGVMAMTEAKYATDFGMKSTDTTIKHKACQRALVNTMELNFRSIYILEVKNLVSNKN